MKVAVRGTAPRIGKGKNILSCKQPGTPAPVNGIGQRRANKPFIIRFRSPGEEKTGVLHRERTSTSQKQAGERPIRKRTVVTQASNNGGEGRFPGVMEEVSKNGLRIGDAVRLSSRESEQGIRKKKCR